MYGYYNIHPVSAKYCIQVSFYDVGKKRIEQKQVKWHFRC